MRQGTHLFSRCDSYKDSCSRCIKAEGIHQFPTEKNTYKVLCKSLAKSKIMRLLSPPKCDHYKMLRNRRQTLATSTFALSRQGTNFNGFNLPSTSTRNTFKVFSTRGAKDLRTCIGVWHQIMTATHKHTHTKHVWLFSNKQATTAQCFVG